MQVLYWLHEYSPMFTEPEVNYCFSIIFRGEYQGLQNNVLQDKTKTQHCLFVYTFAAIVLMIILRVH